MLRPPRSTLFPYTTLFRSIVQNPDFYPAIPSLASLSGRQPQQLQLVYSGIHAPTTYQLNAGVDAAVHERSEEHTSELQSRRDLVCRLLLEKKNTNLSHTET